MMPVTLSSVCALALGVGLGLGLPLAASAQPAPRVAAAPVAPTGGPAWGTLAPSERAALAPLQSEWASISESQKVKWIDLARRMPAMQPAERERIQVRMAEWARMTPAERGRARLQFQETRRITPSDKQERWQAYQALPPEQRQALAAQAAKAAKSPATPSGPGRPGNRAEASVEKKKNTVPFLPPTVAPKAVGPTVVQSRPGATTQLVNNPSTAPLHQQAGLPKVPATKAFVDQETLLPKRGPQAAAIAAPLPPRTASAADAP
jgi:hypothetical protein